MGCIATLCDGCMTGLHPRISVDYCGTLPRQGAEKVASIATMQTGRGMQAARARHLGAMLVRACRTLVDNPDLP